MSPQEVWDGAGWVGGWVSVCVGGGGVGGGRGLEGGGFRGGGVFGWVCMVGLVDAV